MEGNYSDNIVNLPKKEFTKVIVQVKANQGMSKDWLTRNLQEFIILGDVRNVEMLSDTSAEFDVRSILMDLVKTAIVKNAEVMKFYPKE